MEPADTLKRLILRAEQLHRRWFRQLSAIEGEPQWPAGWQRLEALRDLTLQARRALEAKEEEMEQLILKLEQFLAEEMTTRYFKPD